MRVKTNDGETGCIGVGERGTIGLDVLYSVILGVGEPCRLYLGWQLTPIKDEPDAYTPNTDELLGMTQGFYKEEPREWAVMYCLKTTPLRTRDEAIKVAAENNAIDPAHQYQYRPVRLSDGITE